MGQALPAAGTAGGMEWIEVSPEMTAVLGDGSLRGVPMPGDPILVSFDPSDTDRRAMLRIGGAPICSDTVVILYVARTALLRLGGRNPDAADRQGYHLPTELRAILLSLGDSAMTGESRTVYRLAKCIELLCETVRLQRAGALVPFGGDGALSFSDTRRLLEAKRMIDERWAEKLTLATIARSCGLNRAKLTSGFKDLFGCTVAEALAERRLCHASRMLLTTDKPVSAIGYENGYLNNASFARAFARRFGTAPSNYRMSRVAA